MSGEQITPILCSFCGDDCGHRADEIETLRSAMAEAAWALRHDIGRDSVADRLQALASSGSSAEVTR